MPRKCNDTIKSLTRMEAHTKIFFGYVTGAKASGSELSLNELANEFLEHFNFDYSNATLLNAYYLLHNILLNDRDI